MLEKRSIIIEGKEYQVILSDQKEALLAARAAGRAFVGVLTSEGDQDLSPAQYLVENVEDADDRFLERIVRRKLGLPWVIGESSRLLVREFVPEDAEQMLPETEDRDGDRVFQSRELLEAYIGNQYGFFEYGMWAVVRKRDGKVIGKAGICGCGEVPLPGAGEAVKPESGYTGGGSEAVKPKPADGGRDAMELGYHLAAPYRGRGYGREACRIILSYIEEMYDAPVYARVQPDNTASVRLLEALGFQRKGPEDGSISGASCMLFWKDQGHLT